MSQNQKKRETKVNQNRECKCVESVRVIGGGCDGGVCRSGIFYLS